MKFRDVHKMNLATVRLFSLQTFHYGTIRPTTLERGVLMITNKLILAGIFSYTRVHRTGEVVH